MSDEEEIVLSTDNCEIKNSDISTLSPHTYLNDLIISFYYEFLQKKYHSDLITLLDPAVSMSIILDQSLNDDNLEDIKQCIFLPLELNKKKFIFAPINDNKKLQYTCSGSHWTLNLVDVDNCVIYYLDSNLGDVSNAHTFHKKLEKLFGKKFDFIYGLQKDKYQNNSYDCGMFLLGFSEVLMKHIINNNLQIKNNGNNKKGLDFIFEGENLVKQSYMPTFRKNIINLIYDMAKKAKK